VIEIIFWGIFKKKRAKQFSSYAKKMEFVANVIMTSFSHRSDSWNRNATLTQDKMQGEQEQEKDSRVAKPNKTK